MLKDDFYSIVSVEKENNAFKIKLALNADHAIFEGHFPGQSVVPGACLVQMVKEILETALDKKLRLTKAVNIKFLTLINPHEYNTLQMVLTPVVLEDGVVNVTASLSNGTSLCFKFIGSYQER